MEYIRRVIVNLCRTTPILSVIMLASAWGASSPFELDLKELDTHRPPVVEKQEKVKPHVKAAPAPAPRKAATKHHDVDESRVVRYTVKNGDHVFRILMRELGLSNDEAERLLPTVARINGLADVRKLTVGQVLLLPAGQAPATHPSRKYKSATVKSEPAARKEPVNLQVDAPPALSPAPEPAREDSPTDEKEPSIAATVPVDSTAPPSALPDTAPQAQVPTQEPTIMTAAETKPPPASESPSPRYPVRILPISGTNGAEIVDGLTKALGITAEKMRIVELKAGVATGNPFSIKVDRYFEDGGQRFIINCTEKDQFNYTLLRLLEQEGYRVIHAERGDFRSIAESLLTRLKKVHEFTIRQMTTDKEAGNKEIPGILVGDGMADVQLFLHETDGPSGRDR